MSLLAFSLTKLAKLAVLEFSWIDSTSLFIACEVRYPANMEVMQPNETDPVVDEIRELRCRISERLNHDPARLVV